MSYEIDYKGGEKVGCSSKIIVADRIFYVKLSITVSSRFFYGDQQGIIQKEISITEFDLWINVLADNEIQAAEIRKKLEMGKRY